ncbi:MULTISPECIES: VOC family protein [unclassified Sinorhizobium]|uniref:VOC family protein n=1 Tax=unclassified Sinorhizobium TaxID=2613772 RepID=UPI003525C214
MLHHVSFGVSDIKRSAAFYDAALAPLGYIRVWEDLNPDDPDDPDQAIGYGLPGGGDKFAIKLSGEACRSPGPGFHLAFASPNRQAVAFFHEAALAQGGLDNGAPGLRSHYGPNYFAAFVVDPDGHHIEAVCNSAA